VPKVHSTSLQKDSIQSLNLCCVINEFTFAGACAHAIDDVGWRDLFVGKQISYVEIVVVLLLLLLLLLVVDLEVETSRMPLL